MQRFLVPFLLLAAVGAAATATAQSGAPVHRLRQLGEDQLRDLDNAQLRVLRRAERGCRGTGVGFIRAERNPCVIMSTDRAIAEEGGEALQDFHWALPDTERYDEHRTSTVWRAWLH